MRPISSLLLFMLLFAASSLAHAQEPGSTLRLFSKSAISRALADLPAHLQSPLDPRSDWSQVRQLAATTEIVLSARGMTPRKCRFLSASDTILTVVDREDVNRATLQIPRDDVTEIRRWTGRRGSPLGAVLGAAGGFALGFFSAVSLAFKQCGDSCADERLLIGLSLVGMPIGGGLAGYYLLRKDQTLTTIYLKP